MTRSGIDVRHLPHFAFGHRMPIWWGQVFFMVIEGSGFLMLFAAWGYLASQNADWPMVGRLPDPKFGTLLTALLIVSELPNHWLKKRVEAFDLPKVRLGMVVMSLIGLAAIAIRGFAFTTLNVRWDENAFGSIVWALIFLHTTHIVIDVAETLVMTVMSFVGPLDGPRMVDLTEDCDYWHFVVLTWLPVYFVVYWLPRWLG